MTLNPKNSSQKTSAEGPDLDAESLNAIRSILTEQNAPGVARPVAGAAQVESEPRNGPSLRRKADGFPPLNNADSPAGPVASPVKKRFSFRGKAAEVAKVAPSQNTAAVLPGHTPAEEAKGEDGWKSRVKAYRPKPVHIALAAFSVLVLTRPWLVFGLLVLFAIILIGVFLVAGYDGFWQGVMKAGRWYAKRNPARAVAVNKRLDAFAMRWDAILDRFPEGSVDGLYLPDFGDLAMADKRHDEAVDRRLAGMAEKPS